MVDKVFEFLYNHKKQGYVNNVDNPILLIILNVLKSDSYSNIKKDSVKKLEKKF